MGCQGLIRPAAADRVVSSHGMLLGQLPGGAGGAERKKSPPEGLVKSCTLRPHTPPIPASLLRSEKARRRDPRIYNYLAIPCEATKQVSLTDVF